MGNVIKNEELALKNSYPWLCLGKKHYFLCDKRIITPADGLLQSWKKSSVREGLTKPSVPSRKSCGGGNKKILFQFHWFQIIPTLSFPSDLLGNDHGAKIFVALPAY